MINYKVAIPFYSNITGSTIARSTIFNWRKQNKPYVAFIDKYLNDDDVIEFLKTGKVMKFEFFSEYEKRKLELLKANEKIKYQIFDEYVDLINDCLYDTFLNKYFKMLHKVRLGSRVELDSAMSDFITNYPEMPRKTEYLRILFKIYNNYDLLRLLEYEIYNNFKSFNINNDKYQLHFKLFNNIK